MSTPQSGIQRQHELDALRAFAMLLGIALHGALTYTGSPWIVQDPQSSPFFEWLCGAIHGFRMALFMLVSGYFTMMLWRKRGLVALLKQRTTRVLLPLLASMAIVMPLLIVAIVTAGGIVQSQQAQVRKASGQTEEVVDTVKSQDADALYLALIDGSDPNQVDIAHGLPAIAWAAAKGNTEIVELLLDGGADVNASNADRHGALHLAAFLGHAEVVDLLLKKGANPLARGNLNDTALDSTKGDLAYTKSVAIAMKVDLPSDEQFETNRAACRTRLLAAEAQKAEANKKEADKKPVALNGFLPSLRAQYRAFIDSDRFTVRLAPTLPEGKLFTGELFGHLWFLWQLCWLVAIFAVLVSIGSFLPGSFKIPSALIVTPLRWLWLIPLTMVPQLFMGITIPIFGPDTSSGLLPQPHVLFYYAIFFFFGALYFDCDDRDGRLTQWWWLEGALALFVVLPLNYAYPPDLFLGGLLQVIYAWGMSFGLMGLFRTFLSQESKPVRYLSDSAYWLYLTHLPVLILLQAWLRGWNLSPFVKFTVACVLTTMILLVVYEYMVRYSWIGSFLNGPRKRQKVKPSLEVQPVLETTGQAS